MRVADSQRFALGLALLMLLLLAVLGALQFRWLGAVTRAQEESLRRNMAHAADRIARDIDLEISRAFFSFVYRDGLTRGRRAERLTESWNRFRDSAFEPDLISEVYLVERGAQPMRLDETGPQLRRERLPAGLLEELLSLAPQPPERSAREPLPPESERTPVFEDPLTVVVPLDILMRRGRSRPEARPRGKPEAGAQPPEGGVLLVLDEDVLRDRFLPDLVASHLGESVSDIVVVLFGEEAGAAPLFATAGVERRRDDTWDAARPVLVVHPFPELRWALGRGERGVGAGPPDEVVQGEDPAYEWRVERGRGGPWLLTMSRVEGSLEAAVSRARLANGLVVLGTLLVLGTATLLLLRNARHAARLGEQRVDFVAGVTHELNTPLAAITSAAENLADGVVSEADQVKRYGEMIRGEGHRLTAMIGQVLDFAGMGRSGRPRLTSFDAGAVLDDALDDRRWAIGQTGVEVERRVAEGLPAAWGDPLGLRRVLGNLIDNALKYGGDSGWLGVEVDLDVDGKVRLRVRDRGPGIGRDEARRIFEPFYRGRGVTSSHVHGSGLGLAVAHELVEGMGGRLVLEDTGTSGTTFAVLLSTTREGR